MAAEWFSTFFENAFVNRVNRRMCMRMVRLPRSTYDVLIYFGSGEPILGFFSAPMHADHDPPYELIAKIESFGSPETRPLTWLIGKNIARVLATHKPRYRRMPRPGTPWLWAIIGPRNY